MAYIYLIDSIRNIIPIMGLDERSSFCTFVHPAQLSLHNYQVQIKLHHKFANFICVPYHNQIIDR